ncbi:MAG TPA: phosphotransferase [Vicinamibacterales bacterium]|jgi:aminoglycoside/choline kinase family phosphotransferase|nr:phosphotransferase [Vicinamibacterales bacterium]
MDRPAHDAPEARAKIDGFLERSGYAARSPRVVPLTGDASDRRYFRILMPDSPSIVLSLYSSPFKFDELPFVNVSRLLEHMPIPVPRLLGHADDLGVLALQDLGDVTLQAHLGAATPAEHAALYRQAVALIATLQRFGAELEAPQYLPYGIAFDVEKLTWEMDFFTRHFLEAYRGVTLTDPQRQALRSELADVIDELAAENRVLCHRDYHSRNLMLHESQLYMIDFQDARMGPDTYDLVSLLRDSYVDLPESTVDELIAYFLALRGITGSERAFSDRFDVMALQRNLKALGTFGYQTTARRNPVYIQYIPRTLKYVRDNLASKPRFARLRDILATHVEEFR